MEAILKFDLSDPDDTRAHFRCVKATDMALALFDIVQKLSYKYEEGDTITIEKLNGDLHSILDEYGLIIDELTN